uniref:Uncharacterized protein n=1 Tax=Arundo donax TaxID=35708 RepID=A0A0A8Y7F9_ARUDO
MTARHFSLCMSLVTGYI